ncbi:MAG: long-chain fatty acid--CoA ligase, partial [Calditrichota bacterium]
TGVILAQTILPIITPVEGAETDTLARRVKKHCRPLLEPFKIPVRISLVGEDEHVTARFKKKRK